MKNRTRTRRWALLAAAALAVGTFATGIQVAHAAHTPCDDEGIAGGDVGNDVGPGVVFVGTDALGDPAVCVTTGGPLPEANESVVVDVEDPNPGAPGATVTVQHRSCSDQAATTCSTDDLVGQTGVEDPGVAPTPDLPGGGTLGADLTVTSECIWINGSTTCGSGSTVSAAAWESDLVETGSGGCHVDLPGSGCELEGTTVTVFPDDANPTARVSRSGIPGVPDSDSDVAPPSTCVGIGTTCP